MEMKGAHVQIAIRYIGVLTTLNVMYDMVVKGYMVTRTCTCCNRLATEVRFFDCSLLGLWLIFIYAVKGICFVIIRSLFFHINPSPRTTRVPSGHSSHIYNSEILRVTKSSP